MKEQHRYTELLLGDWFFDVRETEGELPFSNPLIADKIRETTEQLIHRILWHVNHSLTDKQAQIIKSFYLEGRSQVDIAYDLHVKQPAIHKSMHGNKVYGDNPRIWGGSLPKLRRLLESDSEAQSLLQRLRELKEEQSEGVIRG